MLHAIAMATAMLHPPKCAICNNTRWHEIVIHLNAGNTKAHKPFDGTVSNMQTDNTCTSRHSSERYNIESQEHSVVGTHF